MKLEIADAASDAHASHAKKSPASKPRNSDNNGSSSMVSGSIVYKIYYVQSLTGLALILITLYRFFSFIISILTTNSERSSFVGWQGEGIEGKQPTNATYSLYL